MCMQDLRFHIDTVSSWLRRENKWLLENLYPDQELYMAYRNQRCAGVQAVFKLAKRKQLIKKSCLSK